MDKIAVEQKWNKLWQEQNVYRFDPDDAGNKYYMLEMFSYPSGAKLHIGHWYNYGLSDSFARYQIMKGKNVFQPMGFDAFGLPAENYAIKTGVHPEDSTLKNIAVMEQQLKNIGGLFDWDHEIKTCLPDYYKWTQWIFCQLYKKGLAYRKKAPVNWCPSCNTVLANEQVVDGHCERCDSQVVKKDLTQWFFKITDYAEELLVGLDKLDWPEKTKAMQRNWIGKSVGGEITFDLADGSGSFKVFTTRADTLFGCTYVVLAPEHELVDKITTPAQKTAVEAYKDEVAKTNEVERLSTAKEKTGVFTGAYAINPVNGDKVQVWIGDYVLATYGTGAVMGVPAHDERDYKFAKKHGIEIKRVIKAALPDVDDSLPFTEYGVMVNSGKFDGLTSEDGRIKVVESLAENKRGEIKTNYRLRDWLVSRQRYWGAPIPIIYCPHCGEVLDENLPVQLPYDVEFKPDGTSPLAKHEKFIHDVTCPKCGAPATRDADTLDTFVCSSWYYLRYPDARNAEKPFDTAWIDKMLPVDKYVGGAEHACMHLLYARFITKALRDMGYLHFDEPFKSLVHQGVILGPDGNRMSKSHGNVVSPDEYVSSYGADVFRCYMAFGFKYTEGGPWSDDGIKAINKWLDRVERYVLAAYENGVANGDKFGAEEKELNRVRNATIKAVDNDYDEFSFNTAVARMMELVNALCKYDSCAEKNVKLYRDTVDDLLKLLAPLAPHLTEELWQQTGHDGSIVKQSFPVYDESAIKLAEVELLVQFNSRPKTRITVDATLTSAEIEKVVLSDANVCELLCGAIPKKVIVIPNRLVNLIV
ncbi:MAG: leucine--tRNA ligase [Corallococcus sp.]|nr:leucine--tRNA ligase [Corallococcus sp.]MCM1359632.1 leucine--tRNA ligase [Corallococcus sp.]MCM1395224.1 leucine--tRNA ligase [Corallococcus sp.]